MQRPRGTHTTRALEGPHVPTDRAWPTRCTPSLTYTRAALTPHALDITHSPKLQISHRHTQIARTHTHNCRSSVTAHNHTQHRKKTKGVQRSGNHTTGKAPLMQYWRRTPTHSHHASRRKETCVVVTPLRCLRKAFSRHTPLRPHTPPRCSSSASLPQKGIDKIKDRPDPGQAA